MNVADNRPALYIGLMSGTSLDGVDGVLIDLGPGAGFRILAHCHAPFDPALRQSLFELNEPGPNELHRAALAGNGVAQTYAGVVAALLQQSGVAAQQICAIGAHGQTVRHRPGEFDGVGYTSQLLNGALLAEQCGIDVVCDLRSRDVAAGGQGAPLVPAFHHAAFGDMGRDIAVLNLGGIANITLLPRDGPVSGHDCGPGNVLLDLWCHRHTGQPFDDDGAWARSGLVSADLLKRMLQDAYLQRPAPKSTGRDHFNDTWLQRMLATSALTAAAPLAADVQATLAQLTVQAAALDLRRALPTASRLLVCGGGALNSHLLQGLRAALPGVEVLPINQACDLDPMHVEAAAFAWLAQAFCERRSANLPAVTGARAPRLLGALYPA
jgi:anhydro-N-acetylmuramic acid kinase